tara:strand:+ start:6027 stop:6245 length:219 start_codon:yes stop_codon:yes gene_type:complete
LGHFSRPLAKIDGVEMNSLYIYHGHLVEIFCDMATYRSFSMITAENRKTEGPVPMNNKSQSSSHSKNNNASI